MSVDFDLTVQYWGHTMERQWSSKGPDAQGREKVQGCLSPRPKVGQTALLHDGTIWRFEEVIAPGTPPDAYFATVAPAKAMSTAKMLKKS